MKVWKLIRLGLIGLSVSVGVGAQTLSRAPSAEEACLTPGPAERGMPEYPKEALARRDSAQAQVAFTFTGPDQAPQVKALGDTSQDAFFDAIKAYAKRFRVPCMASGAPPATIEFQFNFVPNDDSKVVYFVQESPAGQKRRLELTSCLKRPPSDLVRYPKLMLQRESQGVVVASLRFDKADAPPQLTILHDGGHPTFAGAMDAYIREMRLPCLADGEHFETRLDWIFKMEGGARGWIKDQDLMSFLGAVKGIEKEKVFFDFNTMKCPFIVSFQLRQPYTSNRVGLLGDVEWSRLPLIRWLEGLDLKVPARHRELIMANTSQIQVPCGQLDL